MFLSQKLKYHVYLENIEVDFSNISISESKGQVPRAVVSILPIENIFNILPKTLCTITCEMPVRDQNGVVITEQSTVAYDELVVFFGELSSYGMSRGPTNVEIQLTFFGFLENWDAMSITPVDSSIQTCANSVILGINPADSNNTQRGSFFYSTILTPVLSFVQLLQDDTNKEANKVVSNVGLNVGRDKSRQRLIDYRTALVSHRSALYTKSKNMGDLGTALTQSGNSLKTALQKVVKHLLLNYGVFMHSMTKSLMLDTMINYIGSEEYAKLIKPNSAVQFISTGLKETSGNATPISEVLKNILPYINYTYTEFAAPIISSDSTTPIKNIVSKILVHPDMSFFAPIANNVFFDDDIVTAQFGRNFNIEPTRLIRLSNQITTTSADGKQPLFGLLLATIVPANIVVGTVVGELGKLTRSACLGAGRSASNLTARRT